MADGQQSGVSSPKHPKKMSSGSKSPTRIKAHPKGNVSPTSTRSGGSATPKSRRSPTPSAIQPLERQDRPRITSGRRSPKQTGSPKRGASLINLTHQPAKKLVQGKTSTATGPSASGRASPNRAGLTSHRPSLMTSTVVPQASPGVIPKKLHQSGTPEALGDLSPKHRGSPTGLRERLEPQPGDASPRQRSPKAVKSGSASPKLRSWPRQKPSPLAAATSSTPPVSGIVGGPGPEALLLDAPGNTDGDVSPTGGRPPSGESTPIHSASLQKEGAPASLEPLSAKDQVAATNPAADAGPSTVSPTEAAPRKPTMPLKDPWFRHIARAISGHRRLRRANARRSGTSSPKGRASPSISTPYYASDDDESIIEFATSQARPTTSGGI
ncbi:hypothetical protein MRX96_058907 [Rhipicephalus microplus]